MLFLRVTCRADMPAHLFGGTRWLSEALWYFECNRIFVFSMSHPMATAWDGQYDRYTQTESGERLFANISNYMVEGKRSVKWVVEDYEVYHRTFSSLVNSIVNAGFLIEECEESYVSDEMRKQYPAQFGGTLHRPDFIFFRCKKQS